MKGQPRQPLGAAQSIYTVVFDVLLQHRSSPVRIFQCQIHDHQQQADRRVNTEYRWSLNRPRNVKNGANVA